MESNWIFFVKYQRISLGFLNINWNKLKIWNILRILRIICNEVLDEDDETIPKNFDEKKETCKMQNFYILLAFLLITIALLTAVSIYCYLIKYWAKNLLPFHDTKLKQFCIDNINWKCMLQI